jgi:hypothetical protein
MPRTGIRTNAAWCETLNKAVPQSWSDEQRNNLARRLKKIRKLYLRRNKMVHASLGIANDGSIARVPKGSIVDLRTYGLGFSKRQGNTFTIGIVGKRIHLHEIDRLIDDLHKARVGLAEYMDLIDAIKHPPKPFPTLRVGKLLSS